jgi:pimeloyl-ACP methyl ester carboxylesterase
VRSVQAHAIKDAKGRTLYAQCSSLADQQKPAVVLLHASPLSSESLQPLMQQLQADFDVIAFDTPGYGESDPIEATSLQDYADQFVYGLRQLGIERFHLYGVATGAQIAQTLAKTHPFRVLSLWMEGACHFEAHERERILRHYFPDLSAKADGSHLQLIWHICQRLFKAFPWFSDDPNDQLELSAPPVALLELFFKNYLKAGPDYARAYRLAFENEHASQFFGLSVPSFIVTRSDSILAKHTENLLQQALPACVQRCAIASGAARYASLHQKILAFVSPKKHGA